MRWYELKGEFKWKILVQQNHLKTNASLILQIVNGKQSMVTGQIYNHQQVNYNSLVIKWLKNNCLKQIHANSSGNLNGSTIYKDFLDFKKS